MSSRILRSLPFAALWLVIGLLIGAAMVHFKTRPWQIVMTTRNVVSELWRLYPAYLGWEPVNQLFPSVHDGDGVTIHDAARVAPGHTLLSGLVGETVGLRLIDIDGTVLREWRPSAREILADADHIEGVPLPSGDFFVELHGAALLPDGGVVFNISYYATVKMSACGAVEWVVPSMGHHSVHLAESGNVWAATRFNHEAPLADHPALKPQFWEDAVMEIAPDGTVLRTISMLDLMAANNLAGRVFAGGWDVPTLGGDTMHLNDVEVLGTADAAAFDMFEPGDVMVSLRNPNLVVVFDPDTLAAKWRQTGPWIRQHDPDFAEDGRIVVFDNRNGDNSGDRFGGSRVLAITPEGATGGAVEVLYANGPDSPFWTPKQGMLDLLPNGNLLLAESKAGRALEVAPGGDVVWEYVNAHDAERSGPLLHAERYPAEYTGDAYAACD